MDLQTLTNSPLGIWLTMKPCQWLPPASGYRLADFLAERIAARKASPLVAAVRANQQVVHRGKLSEAELDEITHATFRHTARCQYDLYHNLHNLRAMRALIQLGSRLEELIERSRLGLEGAVLVGVHMSNFDFVLQAAGMSGLHALTLGVAQPGRGYRWQNELRQKAGIELLPASPFALRQAVKRLRAGGTVVSGVDRPIPNPKIRPRFFGRPSALPTHYVHMALEAGVPVVIAAALMRPDGTYAITTSEPIEMQPHPQRRMAVQLNTERVLSFAEGLILQAPYQWSMFYPVWPDGQ